MAHKVAVIKVKGNIYSAVENAISLIGFELEKNTKVVIKPNLCSIRSPESGVTTDVCVVEALIDYLQKNTENCSIKVVESNSDYNADEAFKRLGYKDLAEKYRIGLCNLSKDKIVKMQIANPKKIAYIEVPETLLLMDHFISVAKLKTHAFERLSGVWKNQFGLIPKKSMRPRLHPFLSNVLFDLNSVFCPELSIIDGIIALTGPGPLEGTPRNVGVIICSKNPLSADIVASKIMGFSPKQVPHLKYALKHGLGDAIDIEIVGDADGANAFTSGKNTFIPLRQYLLYRFSLWLGRVSRYLENAANMAFTSAYAIRTVGVSGLTSGRMFSIKKLIHEINELLFKIG